MQDENIMLTASGDQNMKMWDVQQRKCIGVLIGHKGTQLNMSLEHMQLQKESESGMQEIFISFFDLKGGKENLICSKNNESRHG
ncbi:hypothetical protein V2J09_013232 [Rumex salicifolius]